MGYLYRLPEGYSLNPFNQNINLDYLPIKKKYKFYTMDGNILIYVSNEHGEGIFGFGSLLSDKIFKSSELKSIENNLLINRNFFQIHIHLNYSSVGPLVEKRFLRHFPTYNQGFFDKRYRPYKLYFSLLYYDIEYLFSTFFWDFSSRYSSSSNINWYYYIHLLREKHIVNNWIPKLSSSAKQKCSICGFKSEKRYFFDLHDTVKINFSDTYVPIKMDNYVPICPNCHRNIHIAMHNG